MKKNESLSRFIRSSGIFFLGNVSSKIITFLMLPLYTSLIPTEDMGYYDVSITYMNIAVSIIYFEIWSAVLRFMYDNENEDGQFSSMKSGFLIFCASSAVFVACMALIGNIFNIAYWELIFLYGLLQCLVSFYTFSTRGLNRNIDFSVSGVLSVFVNASVNIIQIAVLKKGFTAMYYGFIIGSLAQIIYLELRTGIMRKIFKAKLELLQTKKMLFYALPLCLNTVAYWMMTGFNRIALNVSLGNSANGIFAVGNRFGTLITFATTCFTYAWQDLSFSKAKNTDDRAAFYSKACNVYFKFLMVGMIVLIPVCHWIFEIMINDNYAQARGSIPLFLCIAVFSAVSSFVGNVFYAIKETKVLFISTVASALLNCILAFPMIKLFGMNGANISAIIGFLSNILIRYIILKKKIGFKMNWLLIGGLIVLWGIEFAIFMKMNFVMSIVMFAVNCAIGLIAFNKEVKTLLIHE